MVSFLIKYNAFLQNIMEGNLKQSNYSQTSTINVTDPQFKAEVEKMISQKYSPHQFQELIVLLQSQDILEKHKGIIGIRKILSIDTKPPIQLIINSGALPTIIHLMKQNDYPQLQREAAWILTNVAAGTTLQCKSIVDLGVIPLFVNLLTYQDCDIVEQAIWGIGNIGSDCIEYRNAIIKAGGIQKLTNIGNNSSHPNLIKQSAWALSNLCRPKPLPNAQTMTEAIQTLCRFIVTGKISDKEGIAECCWGIAHNSSENDQIDIVINSGIVPFLAKLLEEKSVDILVPALRILGNISTGDAKQTDVLLQKDIVLPKLQTLLHHRKKNVVREICWLLSNIAAGTKLQVDVLLKRKQLVNHLVNLFQTGSVQIKKEICFIFSNMSCRGNSHEVFNLFREYPILPCVIQAFDSPNVQVVKVALECLNSILLHGEKNKNTPENPFILDMEATDAITKLERLQCHSNCDIYKRSQQIIETYFIVIEQ